MNFSFRQLRLFLALAETGSVTAAAKATHITQPTASMRLKELSDAVGLPLFEVIAKKVRLTDAGRDLAVTAREIQNTWELYEQQLNALKGLARGKLRIAVVSTAKYFIPRLLGTFCHKYPDIEVSLEIQNRDGVLTRMRENLDDLYIMSMPPSDLEINDHIFMDNPLIVIASIEHPLTKQKNLTLSDLVSEKFILRERGSGTRMAIDNFFKSKNFKPNLRMELGSNEAIREAVAGDLGLGVLSKHALTESSNRKDIKILTVADFPIQSAWHIVSRKGKNLPPIALYFKEHLINSVPASI
jgi:DNA-binding transcriptional LysR family regulator